VGVGFCKGNIGVCLNDCIHIVPFVIDNEENIVLKTVFPSRKFNKIYRGNK